MLALRSFVVVIAGTTLSVAALSLPVQKNPPILPKDEAAIIEIETELFKRLETEGVEKLFFSILPDLPQNLVEQAQTADKICGKLNEIQEFKSEPRGSRFMTKWYVTIHEGCMLHWKISYRRERALWAAQNVNFNTDPQPY